MRAYNSVCFIGMSPVERTDMNMNQRFKNHSTLIVITVISLGVSIVISSGAAVADQLSIVSAYLCLLLLGAALMIGPLHVFRKGRPLGHSYIRRDIGIWAALNGLLHFFLANVLAMNYEYLGIYVDNALVPPSPEIRSQLYSWGTILGYVIAVLFIVLVMLSNDWMVRKVGTKWWKRIQRLSYLGFLSTCAHAFAFQALESREALWITVVLIVTMLVLIGQGYGIISVKRLRTSKSHKAARTAVET